MSGNYLQRALTGVVQERREVGLRHIVIEPGPAMAGIGEIGPRAEMAVDAKDYAAVGRGVLQVGAQPAKFVGSELAAVAEIADCAVGAALVGEDRVVHTHIMDVAEVERKVARPERPAEGSLGKQVRRDIRVIVVVAGNHVNRNVESGQLFLERLGLIKQGVPVLVPAAVAKAKGNQRRSGGLGLGLRPLEFGLEACAELLHVVAAAVRQVTVSKEYGFVRTCIKGLKHEVVHLRDVLV